jgi:RNA polymerase sigma factor (sigma-70 family)
VGRAGDTAPEVAVVNPAFHTSVAAVVEQARPRLVRVLRAHRIPATDSEDLLQDALVALLGNWHEVRDPASWLVGVLRHLCQKYLRARRQHRTVGAEPELLAQGVGAVASTASACEARRDLERLLHQLSPRRRRLLRLFVLGHDDRELARALGQARPLSARRARYRALQQLRALFGRLPRGKA